MKISLIVVEVELNKGLNTFKTQGKHLCLDLNAWINFNSWLNMHDSISGQIMLFEFFKYHCLYISYVTENIFALSYL